MRYPAASPMPRGVPTGRVILEVVTRPRSKGRVTIGARIVNTTAIEYQSHIDVERGSVGSAHCELLRQQRAHRQQSQLWIRHPTTARTMPWMITAPTVTDSPRLGADRDVPEEGSNVRSATSARFWLNCYAQIVARGDAEVEALPMWPGSCPRLREGDPQGRCRRAPRWCDAAQSGCGRHTSSRPPAGDPVTAH